MTECSAADEMALDIEDAVDGGMGSKKPLG